MCLASRYILPRSLLLLDTTQSWRIGFLGAVGVSLLVDYFCSLAWSDRSNIFGIRFLSLKIFENCAVGIVSVEFFREYLNEYLDILMAR